MKKVLVIGCDFSPSSLPNALRLRFLVSHLKEFGWEPIVLTTDTEYSIYPTDQENNKLLPKDLEVIRSNAIPLKYTTHFGLNDIGLRSLWHYWKVISKYCSQGLIDIILISVPAFFPMVLGRLANKKFGIPYIIDYQDPWVSDYFLKLPKEKQNVKAHIAYRLSKLLEPKALSEASGIIGVSQGTIDGVLERYPLLSNIKTEEIPLGIEPEDFKYIKSNPRKNSFYNRDGEFINICYIGVYAPSMEHTVRALFNSFKLGLEEKNLFSKIKFNFIGTSYSKNSRTQYEITNIAKEFSIQDHVFEYPERVPYLVAIQLMQDAHALLAIGSEEPHYTASKIFPYILAKRPILAIFHEDSTVVDILDKTCAGTVITFNSKEFPHINVEKIKQQLDKITLLAKDYQPPTNWESFQSFTAKAMSQKLARFLDQTAL